MSGNTGSFQENLLRWLLLLLIVPPLAVFGFSLTLNLIHQASYGTLAMVVIAAIICFQFETAAARIAVAVFVLCLLPSFVGTVFNEVNPFALCLALFVVCSGAYRLLKHRYGHKPQPTKIQGAERTPVLPPGSEDNAISLGSHLGPEAPTGDGSAPEETH